MSLISGNRHRFLDASRYERDGATQGRGGDPLETDRVCPLRVTPAGSLIQSTPRVSNGVQRSARGTLDGSRERGTDPEGALRLTPSRRVSPWATAELVLLLLPFACGAYLVAFRLQPVEM